jgi:hypothetical protein
LTPAGKLNPLTWTALVFVMLEKSGRKKIKGKD